MEQTIPAGLPADITAGTTTGASLPSASGYEFSEAQNEVFRGLAKAMSFVGMFYLIGGGILGLATLIAVAGGKGGSSLVTGVQAVFFFPVGFWTRRAASAARAITTSQGHDVEHLMAVIGELRRVFVLQRALLLGFFLVGVLAGLAVPLFKR